MMTPKDVSASALPFPGSAFSNLEPSPPNTLRYVPIGGLGEIGMNMSMLEYDGKIVIIDCGQNLPDESLPGIDVIVPDVAYLEERSDDIVGIVVTHGHEDHIGALGYLAPKLGAPTIHAPAFAADIIRSRFKEVRPDPRPEIVEYTHKTRLKLGPFEFEFIRVTHSMPNCFALGIHTPIGTLIWSGDFKIDPNGVGDDIFDFHAFARLAENGVLALFIDSTNAAEAGNAGHEIDLIEPIDNLFWEANRAIFFSTFGSSLHRMQTVLDLAEEHQRKVVVMGRSMKRNFEIGEARGYLRPKAGIVVEPRAFKDLPPSKQLVLCTGSQGEPMSALSRLSMDNHQSLRVVKDDLVLISARMIPGNERSIYRMVNHFNRHGARVVTSRDANIHCSGHAKRMEIKQLMAICRPRHVIPIHGEIRHQMAQRSNARDLGIPENRIHVLERGDVFHLDKREGKVVGHLPIGRVLVDGKNLEGVDDVVIRDRKHLAEDGMLVVIISVDSATGEFVQQPEIITRGFIVVDQNEHIIDELRQVAADSFRTLVAEARQEPEVISSELRKALKDHVRRRFDRYPVILPMVIEL